MQAEFRAPRRRTRVQEDYEAPLPVNRRPEEEKILCRAELINQHVLIRDQEQVQKIHNQGFFGKGSLSRARPDHSISDQWEEHEGLFLPRVSQDRYEELLRWAGATLSAQGLDKETVNQTLFKLSQPVGTEDLKGEGQVENGQEGAGSQGGASSHTERAWLEGGASPHRERAYSEGGASPHTERAWPEGGASSHIERACSEGGASSHTERAWSEGGASPHTEAANSSPDSFSDSDSEPGPGPGPGPLVPGPGFVLVVSDSEAAVQVREVRRTPLSLSEYLQLSLEEAFFLVYGLGCLSVHMHQEPLSIIQLWRKFRSLRPDFVSSYAAYHHFRSRGWVPKEGGGAKYGVNLMLYRKGPPFYHASYSVVIERADDAFRGSALRPFSWRSLAALSRITANVSKELMLCYVVYPADQSEAELDSPECLSRLKVQEVIVSRWVSSRERAEQDNI